MNPENILKMVFENAADKNTASRSLAIFQSRIVGYPNISIDVLSNIANNQQLLISIFNAEYGINPIEFSPYYCYSEVSIKFKFGNVLIYIPILGLYQLFDNVEKYQLYLERMQDKQINNLLFQQLVLISAEHKFILRCENKPELIDKIKLILNTNIVDIKESPGYVQLTFNTLKVSNFAQEQIYFEKIMRHILDAPIYIPRHGNDTKFVENDITYTDKSVIKMLKNIEKYVMQCNTVKGGNVTNIVIEGNGTINLVNKVKNTDDKYSIVDNWLKANPINEKILQSDYRKKFLDDTGCVMHNGTFGKRAAKFVNGVSTNGTTWYEPLIK